MASQSSAPSQAAAAAAAATPPTPGDDTQVKSCFICLETSAETPGEVWVTPCPCTLEAHEKCMLHWIAESEVSGAAGKKKLRCPACKGRIRTVEPWDPVVELQDQFTKVYRRTAPFILVSFFTTMSIAGSGYYGFQAMHHFAGLPVTVDWLGFRRAVDSAATRNSTATMRHTMTLIFRFFLLSLIAPSLLLQKALPSLMNLLALPASVMYGASLVSRNILPTWPLTPGWALAMVPYVNIAYSNVYYDLERLLHRSLRRGGPLELNQADGQQFGGANQGGVLQAQQGQGGQQGQQQDDHRGEGVLAAFRRVREAVGNLWRNDDDGVVLENVGAAAAFGNGRDMEFQLEIVVGGGGGGEPPNDEGQDIADAMGEAGDLAALPPPDIHRARPDQAAGPAAGQDAVPANGNNANAGAGVNGNGGNGNQNQNQNGNDFPPVDGERAVLVFMDFLAAIATQLMLPRISSVSGDILKRLLPLAWVTRHPASRAHLGMEYAIQQHIQRKPTGLLQEKWGRSLVGGCIFIVLRDAWGLYAKYRRVQVMRHRKIRNVDRRKHRDNGR